MKFIFFHNKSFFNINHTIYLENLFVFKCFCHKQKKKNMHTTYFQNKRFCPILKSP